MWPWIFLLKHFGNLFPLWRTLDSEIRKHPDDVDASCLLRRVRLCVKGWLYLCDCVCFSLATESVRKASASAKPVGNLRILVFARLFVVSRLAAGTPFMCSAWSMLLGLVLLGHFGNELPLGRAQAGKIQMQPDDFDAFCLLPRGRSCVKD